jgi:DNA polymerase IV
MMNPTLPVHEIMNRIRKIIHIDMDAFYASVEQRDNPELKGKPVIVGGSPDSRGVVATCSYEARKFGIHSAMASSKAYKLCPYAVFLKPEFEKYKSVSSKIRKIFHEYTDLIEPLSLDEAFLDVTESRAHMGSASLIAREVLRKIYKETGELTASAGVSFNKFLAKAASDYNKPNGITIVTPGQSTDFIEKLPVRKFFGVGRVTEKRMHAFGIKTGFDLKKVQREQLVKWFGKAGSYFYNIAHGKDNRPVNPARIRKSIGKEITLETDINDKVQMLKVLTQLACNVERLLKKNNCKAMIITLKVKYFDFKSVSRSISVAEPLASADIIMKYVAHLLKSTKAGIKKVRLLGISVSGLISESTSEPPEQMILPFENMKQPCNSRLKVSNFRRYGKRAPGL